MKNKFVLYKRIFKQETLCYNLEGDCMMDLQKEKYIIVEVIPTHSDCEQGFIAQISALKLDGIKLEDRFDYRVDDKFIENDYLKSLIQYDKQHFTYVNNIYFIIEKFKQWAKDYPLLLLEEEYTKKYLSEMKNEKMLVYPYLELEFDNDIFNKVTEKYQLQPTEHLVDLVYEAIIYEGNNKKKKEEEK